ncbi:hypothetical protein [Streptomyces niveus]|uniref:recombination directionality factor n=1 Tax=Streptomyces niveus TaxID=193462 RepID=UPI0003C57595|nr:hypothetical protein [Streptomyces niveus]EST22813.1 hypothetical protein M877_28980 [Streptomyces niveus NCIMB 11891]
MGSRILTMKRQAAELGRIRTGYSVPNSDPNKRPIMKRSKTFVISSHSEQYVAAAAAQWGGTVERWTPQNTKIPQFRVITAATEIRAILPAGDPLSQAYEMWSGGGCSRRCDGETEQKTRQPCICLAQFGEDWHTRSPKQVCRPTSRINVMLPELPDLGVWRLETKSHYAADAMAGGIDIVLQATGGESLMPVRMWIEQRTVVRDGETKNFPVVMVVPSIPKLRHALSGPLSMAAALDPSSLVDRPAIEAPRPDYVAEARQCKTVADARAVWHRANRAGHVDPKGTDPLSQELVQIAQDIEKGVDTRTGDVGDQDGGGQPDGDGVYDVEVVGEDSDDEPPTAYPSAVWPDVATPGGGGR